MPELSAIRVLPIWPILALALLSVANQAAASKKGKALALEEVAVSWFGVTEDENTIFRLDLDVDGTGAGAYVLGAANPVVFSVKSWSYTRNDILLEIEFSDDYEGDFCRTIEGVIVGHRLTLTIRGSDWFSSVHLRREKDFIPGWEKLVEAMRFIARSNGV